MASLLSCRWSRAVVARAVSVVTRRYRGSDESADDRKLRWPV